MAAATRKPVASKKRKLEEQQLEATKKKSPLFNQPQNFYAPNSISSMSKDELSEWRKEQRRKRNRESAAASRNKTRARIDELEGEVNQWKQMHDEMKNKMACMERHIQFLTQLNASQQSQQGAVAPSRVPTIVSHPNSPPRSPQLSAVMTALPDFAASIALPHVDISSNANPANTTNFFPALLSEPKDYTLVEKQEAASAAKPKEEPRKHLTPIPRQA